MVFENAQDRKDTWLMDEDEVKITYETFEKAQNCGTAIIKKEDHTVGNLVRQQLLNYSDVRFAAYQIPHPLDHRLFVRVQTADESVTPMSALVRSLEDLSDEVGHINEQFEEKLQEKNQSTDPFA
eukprot:CAMPEP_0205930776 /NCGR_PEP_ID=MMETSP1325-20131115/26088_1 /ASSEMBLY_ACC=CAM_ASM_000708 /TAXON_ID=236786 /ORGANISM="Florenciella sp., Strain RCC1007" /LENGTH=124 /DNA_ID=CAMNT_0053300213 /DNA_START=129 /DNA_END=500 /DNA_ORIENTATION=+